MTITRLCLIVLITATCLSCATLAQLLVDVTAEFPTWAAQCEASDPDAWRECMTACVIQWATARGVGYLGPLLDELVTWLSQRGVEVAPAGSCPSNVPVSIPAGAGLSPEARALLDGLRTACIR